MSLEPRKSRGKRKSPPTDEEETNERMNPRVTAAAAVSTTKKLKSSSSLKAVPAPVPSSSVRPLSPAASTTSTKTADSSSQQQTGLRHFSMKVCRKVEQKGTTSYSEVADELVQETSSEQSSDEKNIRRRVYDALNVLMAMDIIGKDKKQIMWKGLPSITSTGGGHQDLGLLQREAQQRSVVVQRKREQLKELLTQQVCFRNLIAHNRARTTTSSTPSSAKSSSTSQSSFSASARNRRQQPQQGDRIQLPFIVVNTSSHANIQCEMSPNRRNVMMDFSCPFEINDDNTILKRLGMSQTTIQALQGMFPEELLKYCQDHHLLDALLGSSRDGGVGDAAMAPPPAVNRRGRKDDADESS